MTKQEFLQMTEKECIQWVATINDKFQLGNSTMNFNLYKKTGESCRFPAEMQRFFIEDQEFMFIICRGQRGRGGMSGFGKPRIALSGSSLAMKCGSSEPWTKRHLLFLIREMKKAIFNNLDCDQLKLANV